MAANGYVQVAVDSTGKLIDMESDYGAAPGDAVTRPADGTAVYRQRAAIVGPAADALQTMIIQNDTIIRLLKAISAQLGATGNFNVNPDDFQ